MLGPEPSLGSTGTDSFTCGVGARSTSLGLAKLLGDNIRSRKMYFMVHSCLRTGFGVKGTVDGRVLSVRATTDKTKAAP